DVIAQVYDNLEGIENANNAPNEPYSLDDSSISGDQITLRWAAPVDPANDGGGFTPQEGLLYQLQVGGYTDSTENEHQIITGHYGVGEIGTTNLTAKKLRNMPEGNYKWRVRALDHSGAGSEWANWNYFYIDVTAPAVETIRANYVTSRQVILVVKFKEAFFLDTAIDPLVQVTHPVNPDLNNDDTPDTLIVMKQSFNVDEWTGVLLLPDNDSLRYAGKAIQIHISGAQDKRQNRMERTSIYKTPESIISQYGGTAISQDGNVSVLLPQNAVNKDISITISSITGGVSFGDSTQLITDLYTITTEPVLALNKPGILRIAYSDPVLSDSVLPFICRITDNSELQLLGGSHLTIQNVPYMQVQVDTMGTFGVFTTQIIVPGDSLDTESLICQPRIFSPAGSVFEFANTNILFNLDGQEEVTARIFNLAGRLKWSSKPGSTQRGSNVLNWDGKDSNGNVVASGLYIVTLEKGDSVLRTTVGVLNR
ncbi:MAG: FlgD immunoglobulin-like domain containing protein, partial [Candidatus Neomarinimicrobiota bacterium]|nr:FlgD immunoglobulin-like domain containing protein [Candidatus Neomarinimicrobiota bacterium]